jgi:hypothetical protein
MIYWKEIRQTDWEEMRLIYWKEIRQTDWEKLIYLEEMR